MVAELELAAADRWYVTNGATAVGPVNLDLLTRGIQSGKVPLESFVRHEGWKVWRPLTDIAQVTGTATPLPPTVRASSIPAPPVSTDDITLPGRPALPEDGLAADAIAGATDLREALLLLMAAVVQTLGAEGAIIHRLDDGGATAVCAHGPRMFEVLGQRTRLLDPVIVAAAGGHTVLAEPTPGPAGDALLTRMTSLGLVTIDGAFMMPIRGSSRLLALLEVGRKRRFRATELAAAEALIDALVTNADANGW